MTKISKFVPDTVTLEGYEVDPATILEGKPEQGIEVTWRSPDGTTVAGLFRSSVGKFTFQQLGDESTLVRKGRVIVTADDGSSVDCRAGDVMNIARGTTCTFEVLEDLEDYFVISNPAGVEL